MKSVKNILVTVILLMMAAVFMPSAAYADGHVFVPGHIHGETDIYEVPGGTDSKRAAIQDKQLDPRDKDWYKTSIKVRDQADTGLCWAFAAVTAAQISYAKEIYEYTGTVSKIEPLSPAHLGYFFYNRKNDPLGNTANDKNLGYSGWKMDGGASCYTMLHLSTRSGFGAESKTPFDIEGDYYTYYTGPDSFDDKYAYDDLYTTENTVYYQQCDVNTIKKLVAEYGAVTVSMEYDSAYMNNNVAFYNKTFRNDNNHEVVIVGWDDTYSRDNFNSNGSKPTNNGAWIILNSWGESIHDHGYFYASYESEDILSDGICAYDLRPNDSKKMLFQYDGNANNKGYLMAKNQCAANVFKASKQSEDTVLALDEVSFTEYNSGNMSYDIEVYTELTNANDPQSGTLKYKRTVSTTDPGYKTFKIEEPVCVGGGETFSVVVRFNTEGRIGIEKSTSSFTAGIDPGQSYCYEDNKWTDAASNSRCFRIKAEASVDHVHSWNTEYIVDKEASCKEDGSESQHCVICDAVKKGSSRLIPKTGHNYEAWNITAATELVPGKRSRTCSACGDTQIEVISQLAPTLPAVKISKPKAAKKSATIRWKKVSKKNLKKIKKIEIQYSMDRNFISGVKTTKVSAKKTSKKIKFPKGKKYFVRIRALNGDHVSAWSAVKPVKAK